MAVSPSVYVEILNLKNLLTYTVSLELLNNSVRY